MQAESKREVEARTLLHEMFGFPEDEVDELGTHREIAHMERIIHEGSGADRQLAVFRKTNDVKAVADHIIAETYGGLTDDQRDQ